MYGILGYNRRRKLFIFVSVGVFHPLSRRIVSTTHAPLRALKIRGLLIILSGVAKRNYTASQSNNLSGI
jgi:hypothetical protein